MGGGECLRGQNAAVLWVKKRDREMPHHLVEEMEEQRREGNGKHLRLLLKVGELGGAALASAGWGRRG